MLLSLMSTPSVNYYFVVFHKRLLLYGYQQEMSFVIFYKIVYQILLRCYNYTELFAGRTKGCE